MPRFRIARTIAALWGVTGVGLLLASAIYRLAPRALEAAGTELKWYHLLFLVLVLVFMAYAEGYRAFQLGFSPRVAARARYLRTHSSILHSLFAPLFCMAYFHASRKRRITSLSVTAGIIILIILVRLLPQPWRGIIDIGVMVGLAWGLIALVVFSVQALSSEQFKHSPDVPDER